MVNLPGVRQWAKNNSIIGGGARVSAGFVIVRVAIGAWASVLEVKRIHRRPTLVRRRILLAAAIHRIAKRLTRAPARHAPPTVPTRYP